MDKCQDVFFCDQNELTFYYKYSSKNSCMLVNVQTIILLNIGIISIMDRGRLDVSTSPILFFKIRSPLYFILLFSNYVEWPRQDLECHLLIRRNIWEEEEDLLFGVVFVCVVCVSVSLCVCVFIKV